MINELMNIGTDFILNLPNNLLLLLSGKPQIEFDNKKLNPSLQLLVSAVDKLPGFETLPVDQSRALLEFLSEITFQKRSYAVRTEDIVILKGDSRMKARVYIPKDGKNVKPVLVYYHGGGFVLGSIKSHDQVCRKISEAADCIVVSPEYRLAPEHTFPSAFEDAVAAFSWSLDNIEKYSGNPKRTAVGGDSAGGSLAMAVTISLREKIKKPYYSWLIYPGTDFSKQRDSVKRYGKGLGLTKGMLDMFRDTYLPNDFDRFRFEASPVLAEDFSGISSVYVSIAGFDPLYDEDIALVKKLENAGIKTDYEVYDSLIHGYISITSIPECRSAFENDIRYLRKALHS